MIKKLIAVVMAAFTLGCAGAKPFFSGNPTVEQALAKIAVQQATLRAIQIDGADKAPARAAAIVKIVDQAQAVLTSDGNATVTAADLDTALWQVLPKNLSPADKLLAAQLAALAFAEIGASVPVEQQQLPIAEVSAVLGWVREAAVLVAPAS